MARQTMKKVISGLILFCLLCFSLSACGQKLPESELKNSEIIGSSDTDALGNTVYGQSW